MKFTKHFYIEGQRIVSKLGDMGENQELLNPKDTTRAGNNGNHPIDWDNKHESLKDQLIENFEELGLTGAVFTAGKSGKVPYGQIKKYYRNDDGIFNSEVNNSTSNNNGNSGNKAELLQFYYHLDHLGSSNYITNVSGEVFQHMEYFPFGETFIEERTGTEYTTYLYNGKEFDEEIGLYYYGARYYDPRIGMFYGVDPLADERIWLSPYNYCQNNPIVRIDPNGMLDDDIVFNEKGNYVRTDVNDKPDRLVIEHSTNGSQKIYEFNDPKTDVAAIEYNLEKFGEEKFKEMKFVFIVSDKRINEMMLESGATETNTINRGLKLSIQSKKGKLDFAAYHLGIDLVKGGEGFTWNGKEVFEKDYGPLFLFEGEKKSYNYMDAGNFLWGNAVNRMGGSLTEAEVLSRIFNRKDSKADQWSIVNGWRHNEKK